MLDDTTLSSSEDEDVQYLVRQEYTQRASQAWHIAEYLYTPEELALLPQKAIQSALGLDNPVEVANLQSGEAVLDLGCGGGIDTLLAAQQVGPQGYAIGLDMTPAMVELARMNAEALGLTNSRFVEGMIEDLPFPDHSVDVVLSNGVFNLAPDKDRVFAEVWRVLRPHGRLVVADMLLRGDLPASIRDDPKLWSGWIAGAVPESVWLEKAERAGFTSLKIVRRHPMTMERLARYPIYQEQSMKNLLAQVEPAQRDHLVEVALITARPDSSSTPVRADSVFPFKFK